MGIDGLARPLLIVGNGTEEAVQVLVYRVVVLDELVEAAGQVCTGVGRVVPLEGRVPEVELAVLVV